MDPERALVEEARRGNQEAFADLVGRYQVRVFNLARALTGNEADAAELAQDVFVKIYRGLGTFRGESAFRTWLYRVATNVIRSHIARPSVFRWLVRRERNDADPLETLAAPGDIEARVTQGDAIDRALGQLPTDLSLIHI